MVSCSYHGTDIKVGVSPDNGITWVYGNLDEPIEIQSTTSIKVKFFMTSDIEMKSYGIYYPKA